MKPLEIGDGSANRPPTYPRLPRALIEILERMELDKITGNVVLHYRQGKLMGAKTEKQIRL